MFLRLMAASFQYVVELRECHLNPLIRIHGLVTETDVSDFEPFGEDYELFPHTIPPKYIYNLAVNIQTILILTLTTRKYPHHPSIPVHF